MNKAITIFIVVASLFLVGCFGYLLGKAFIGEVPQTPEAPAGAAGDIYSTQKIAQIGIDVSTSTIASLYNGDSRDRVVLETYLFVEDATNTPGAALTLQVATSGDAYTLNDATSDAENTSYVINELIPTSTPMLITSSTPSCVASADTSGTDPSWIGITWPSGTYLNFLIDNNLSFASGTAYSSGMTATGVAGVRYISE
jgi:hypothetical protein